MQVSSCRLRATAGGQREGCLTEAYLLRFGMRVLAFRLYSLVRDEIWHSLVSGETGRRGSRTWLLRRGLGRSQRRQDLGDAPPLLRPQIRYEQERGHAVGRCPERGAQRLHPRPPPCTALAIRQGPDGGLGLDPWSR